MIELQKWISITSNPSNFLSAAALVISLCVACITWRMFRQKHGVSVRGRIILGSSRASSMPYVKKLVLENQKDKSLTIFGIYADLDGRCLLEIEDLSNDPLVLEPYGAVVQTYDPPDVYINGFEVWDLDELFFSHD